MPATIKNLMNASLKQLYLKTGSDEKPPNGKIWLVLGGCVYHVTGTATYLYVSGVPGKTLATTEQDRDLLVVVPAAGASGYFYLWGAKGTDVTNAIDAYAPSFYPCFITDSDMLRMVGDASATINLKVLEFDQ